ncbi:hypothetical protein COS21_03800 [bacterium (Candidatus Gribaldobacteria) CG02_land_8_20_14_3_00_41_15]|uniref:DUF5666 domain-containing protein n=3 Tax=Candidatus Gribaldobacteria TaxID=2798536 RepID=A0A2M7DCZ7_9BACT|nr:MAG: hypothetical protein COS21_03800 [bacterium (Candidatus Gribaldobacteria) CG02_land_8_20_14_3_00_41_15]
MKKNILLIIILAIVVVGAGSFYGGLQYGKSKSPAGGGLANLSAEQRQARFQQMGGANAAGQRGVRAGNGFTVGEILAKDANSITVKLNDGGSKIVFIATSTQVMKSAVGSLDDLIVGENISVNGAANQDGSITAQSIQLRPASASKLNL